MPGRHLIGSTDECEIQLPLEGIADRHALVLVGDNRTVVKTIDPHTWVNDGPVTETALRPGDRLSIGPLTFRVRAATQEESTTFVPTPVVNIPRPLTHEVKWLAESQERPSNSARSASPHDTPAMKTADTAVMPPEPLKNGHRSPIVDERKTRETTHPVSEPVADNSLMERRLEEIQQRLAELHHTAQPAVQPAEHPTQKEPNLFRRRHEELEQRAYQVAQDAQRVQQQVADVTEREAQLQSRQQQLAQEARRITSLAETTRQNLAQEHSQRETVWQEWEAAYQRMTSQLASQLDAIDQHRATLQGEADRLTEARNELQRARTEFDRDRQDCDVERTRLAVDRSEVSRLNAQLDTDRRQHQAESDDDSARLQAERQQLLMDRDSLLSARQQLDRERQTLLAQFSQQTRQLDEEHQRRAELQARLDSDQQQLLNERAQLSHLESEIHRRRLELERERTDFESARRQEEESRHELDELRRRCQQSEDELTRIRHERIATPLMTSSIMDLPLPITPPPLPIAPPPLPIEPSTPVFSYAAPEIEEVPPVRSPLHVENATIVLESEQEAVPPVTVSLEQALAEEPEAEQAETATEAPIAENPVVPSGFGALVDWGSMASMDRAVDAPAEVPEERPSDLPTSIEQSSPWSVVQAEAPAPPVVVQNAPQAPAEFDTSWAQNDFSTTPVEPVQAESESMPDADPYAGGFDVGRYSSPSVDASSDPWAAFGPASQVPEPPGAVVCGPHGLIPETRAENDPTPESSAFPSPTMEFDSREPNTEVLDATQTLAEVNREFGSPVEPSHDQPEELPSWWVENARTQSDAGTGISDFGRSSPSDSEMGGSSNDLRSQLAMLFDLPDTPSSASDEAVRFLQDEPQQAGPDQSQSFPVEEPQPQPEVVDTPLAATAEATTQSASSEPAPAEEAHDSVDAYMARLLARSRGDSDESAAPTAAAPTTSATPAASSTVASEPAAAPAALQPPDRSHLMAAPKHKQDKQAVRENLQSFREVAHLSARSALAKHSLEQLRNATIAKGILLTVSSLAALWFFAEPLAGKPLQLWKAGVCLLAAVLSGVEFSRSWAQLRKPITAGTEPEGTETAGTTSTAVPAVAESTPPSAEPVATGENTAAVTADVATAPTTDAPESVAPESAETATV